MPRIERFADLKQPEYWLAAKVAEAIEDEGEAIAKYEELLAQMEPDLHKDAIAIIRDISGQEKEHIDKLSSILKSLDKIKTSTTQVNRKIKD